MCVLKPTKNRNDTSSQFKVVRTWTFQYVNMKKKNYLLHMNFVWFSVVAFGSHLSSQAVVMQSVDVLQIETSVQLLKKPKFCTLCVAFEICFKDNGNKSHSTAEGSSSFLFQTLHCTKFKKKPEIFHTYIISTCDVTCMIKIYVFI